MAVRLLFHLVFLFIGVIEEVFYLEIWNKGDFVKKNLEVDIGLSDAICRVVMRSPLASPRAKGWRSG